MREPYLIEASQAPFQWDERMVLYIENERYEDIHAFIRMHYKELCWEFERLDSNLVYMPLLPNMDLRVRQFLPGKLKLEPMDTIAFSHAMFTSSEREQIEGPCLIWRAHVMNENLYWCWSLNLSLNPMQSFVEMLSNWYEYKLRHNLLLADGRNSREKDNAFIPPAPEGLGMGEMFLLKDTQQHLQKMVDRKIQMEQVKPLIAPMPKVSRLRVTSDFRIILTDYEDIEIEMPPLRKAMYLVYLRHPEGINLKYLSDYKDELYHFYEEISRRSKNNPNKLVKWARLERLIDPTDQSSIEWVSH